jgi:DNA-binding transcriptional MerR regulator
MELSSKSIKKVYYSIGEVADLFNVNRSLIRFWEKEFSIIRPKKNKKGNRFFTKKDIENFKIIFHLVKERGYTLDGAKKKLRENKHDTIRNIEIVNELKKIRNQLVALREVL